MSSETKTIQSNLTASERIRAARQNQSLEAEDRSIRGVIALGLVIVAAGVGVKLVDKFNETPPQTATEVVQPGEGMWSVANRAQVKQGQHPEQFNISDEVDRLVKEYGSTLHAGETIEVHVK